MNGQHGPCKRVFPPSGYVGHFHLLYNGSLPRDEASQSWAPGANGTSGCMRSARDEMNRHAQAFLVRVLGSLTVISFERSAGIWVQCRP